MGNFGSPKKKRLACLIVIIPVKAKHIVQMCIRDRTLVEQLENLEADMEQIRYDISVAERALGKYQKEWESVCEQLKLTDYDQIKDRLDDCVIWLENYPRRSRECVRKATENEGRIARLLEQIEKDVYKRQQVNNLKV